ncbi:MAG: amino acid adenylation domain-containing protein, partial [Algicola sp.]|nr:amino acid adenylation domain-containing protein [Algicola sp.]
MNIAELVNTLKQQKVRLAVDGERLLCYMPSNDYKMSAQLQTAIKTQKIELVKYLQTLAIPKSTITKVARDQRGFVLSSQQERVWFTDRFEQGLDYSYNNAGTIDFDGKLDAQILLRCFNTVIQRHESLRTRFICVQDQPLQVIDEQFVIDMPLIEIDSTDDIAPYAKKHGQHLFELASGQLVKLTLLKLSEVKHVLLFNIHHIILDGWSLKILFGELKTLYRAYFDGQKNPLPPLPIQYLDFAHWQQQRKRQGGFEQDLQYWQKQLANAPQLLELPTDRPRAAVQDLHGNAVTFDLPDRLYQQLKTLSLDNGVTLFMTLLTGFKVLLWRYTRQTDLLVGTPIANRNQSQIEGLIGFFVNTLILRSPIDSNDSLAAVLNKVKATTLAAYEHQDLPFELLVNHLNPPRSLSYNPVFQVMFMLQNTQIGQFDLPHLQSSLSQSDNDSAKFDLSMALTEEPGSIHGRLEYPTALFDETTINRMIGHYQTLLEAMVLSPDLTVGELSLLTGSQQHYLLHTLNAKYASNQTLPAKNQSIHELFEQRVELAPHATALVFEQQELDYQAVNQKANRLAHYLRTKGVKPDTLVGLCVQRSMDMVIGLLAVLKAGGAYVPLDPNYPQDRLDYMVKDSGVSLVLTQKELGQNLDQYPTSNPLKMAGQSAASLAYVIYTSGSTGLPKGVMVEHHNVVRLLTATQNAFHFDDQDVWTLFHSYAFDFSVWEIWGALAFGGRLVVVPDWMPRSVDDFYQLLVDEKVTVLNQTPSAFNQLSSIDAQQQQPLSLRVVIFGGEALNLQDLNSWVERHGENKPELVNMYGITETTVHVTYRRILAQDIMQNKGSLIGRPIDDLSFYILNPQLTPVPIGVCGEFFVGGNGVTRGYLNQPELTASRFIVSPFASDETLYRTGDLGRYLPNGEIEYLGRIDEQVKIRGFRIELGEIEQQLVLLPQIKSTVVLVREDQPGLKHLVAYVVCERDVTDRDLAKALRNALQAKLPEHMVPSFFVKLDAFKLTNNGKIDKQWLLSEQMAPD